MGKVKEVLMACEEAIESGVKNDLQLIFFLTVRGEWAAVRYILYAQKKGQSVFEQIRYAVYEKEMD